MCRVSTKHVVHILKGPVQSLNYVQLYSIISTISFLFYWRVHRSAYFMKLVVYIRSRFLLLNINIYTTAKLIIQYKKTIN